MAKEWRVLYKRSDYPDRNPIEDTYTLVLIEDGKVILYAGVHDGFIDRDEARKDLKKFISKQIQLRMDQSTALNKPFVEKRKVPQVMIDDIVEMKL